VTLQTKENLLFEKFCDRGKIPSFDGRQWCSQNFSSGVEDSEIFCMEINWGGDFRYILMKTLASHLNTPGYT